MQFDVTGLHHVGLVVRDLTTAIGTYQRLGFTVPPPTCPALPATPGADPQPIGAANTHISLRHGFVELVAVGGFPPGGRLIPLTVPASRLPDLLTAVRATTTALAARLDRFEGLHIMVAASADLDRTATRLTAAHTGHGGILAVQRPIETPDGVRMVPVRYFDILLDEGRVGFATADGHDVPAHANGAVDLIGCVLHVPEASLADAVHRYETYLGRPARHDGAAHVFDLQTATLTVTGSPTLTAPAFAGFTVAVTDIGRTAAHLGTAGVAHHAPDPGTIVVPAAEAHGATVTFRAAHPAGTATPVRA